MLDCLNDLECPEVELGDAYHVDAEMSREAVRRRESFNLIHLATMMKIDVFVRKTRAFDRQAFDRFGSAWQDLISENSAAAGRPRRARRGRRGAARGRRSDRRGGPSSRGACR